MLIMEQQFALRRTSVVIMGLAFLCVPLTLLAFIVNSKWDVGTFIGLIILLGVAAITVVHMLNRLKIIIKTTDNGLSYSSIFNNATYTWDEIYDVKVRGGRHKPTDLFITTVDDWSIHVPSLIENITRIDQYPVRTILDMTTNNTNKYVYQQGGFALAVKVHKRSMQEKVRDFILLAPIVYLALRFLLEPAEVIKSIVVIFPYALLFAAIFVLSTFLYMRMKGVTVKATKKALFCKPGLGVSMKNIKALSCDHSNGTKITLETPERSIKLWHRKNSDETMTIYKLLKEQTAQMQA